MGEKGRRLCEDKAASPSRTDDESLYSWELRAISIQEDLKGGGCDAEGMEGRLRQEMDEREAGGRRHHATGRLVLLREAVLREVTASDRLLPESNET